MKRACAKKAFSMINDGMIVGLGGGQTVAFLIEELEKSNKTIKAVTPSYDTMQLCMKHKIPVNMLEMTDSIDIAFDGCDELDYELNALKSCGGIHTREKIVASMAKDYILLSDTQKYSEKLSFQHPITIEIIQSSRAFVKAQLENMGAIVKERTADKKAGMVISDDGNYLMEAYFDKVESLEKLNQTLDQIPGIVGHSLFYHIASKAIIAGEDEVKIVNAR